MSRLWAAAGSALFLLVAPGTVAGLLPWMVTGWRRPEDAPGGPVVVILAAALILLGVSVLLTEFARFALQGVGTPAPVAPTRHLVVSGLYRRVRNPMYLAVITTLVGQLLLFPSFSMLAYTLTVTLAMVAFARFYEEPTLLRRFGAEYQAYRDAVPGWIPRRRRH